MKVRKLLLILASASLIHCGFWLLYAGVLSAGSLQRQKAALFRNERNKAARFWIMGDSHPMLALNPEFIPGSFNHAATSEYYFLTLRKLKNLLKESPKPEMIILPLDLHSFSCQGNALLLQHELDDVFWSDILDWKEISKSDLPPPWIRWYLSARFFPYAGQYFRLLSIFKKDPYEVQKDGFVPGEEVLSPQEAGERQAAAKARFDAHFQKFPSIDSLQLTALRDIRKICREEGIRLLLLSFPLSDEYLASSDTASALWEVKALQNSIKKGSLYLDYSRVLSGKPELFSDPDHLNFKGAAILSNMLKKHADSLMKIPASELKGI